MITLRFFEYIVTKIWIFGQKFYYPSLILVPGSISRGNQSTKMDNFTIDNSGSMSRS